MQNWTVRLMNASAVTIHESTQPSATAPDTSAANEANRNTDPMAWANWCGMGSSMWTFAPRMPAGFRMRRWNCLKSANPSWTVPRAMTSPVPRMIHRPASTPRRNARIVRPTMNAWFVRRVLRSTR
jgi:hypothetical protein